MSDQPTIDLGPGDPSLDDLVAQAITALETGGSAAVARLCDEHPDHAVHILGRLAELGDLGLLRHGDRDDHPATIGPYRILSVIGEGGMGLVYRAEQVEPVRRQVALKVVKLGMDTHAVLARFELERRTLAAMNHSCVAKVFDAGTTDAGKPYFVMELVEGLPITEYCDQHRLKVPERLALFQQVCAGVQHAHQKGVMHRDLKPANILVVREGDRALPKILDFGLAKSTNRELIAHSVYTEHAVIIGTPEYMAPEQALGDSTAIDSRSDVYSLGVVLYELLAGELPVSSKELRSKGWLELPRVLGELEVQKPSSRLRVLDERTVARAHRRGTSLRSLARELRGDLDSIVLKAMAKEPERRYDSAIALAEDLGRYLQHEPVVAGPPSTAYRLRKLARRYRTQALALALVMLALVGGVIGTTFGLARARASEREAEHRAKQLEQVVGFQQKQLSDIDVAQMGVDLREAVLAEVRGGMERESANSAEVEAAVLQVGEQLARANFTNVARTSIEKQVFAKARRAIDEQFADQPLVAARLLQTMASTMHDLGSFSAMMEPADHALQIFEAELSGDHVDTLRSTGEMGRLLKERGELRAAVPFMRRALEGRRRVLGNEHEDTLTSMNNLGNLHRILGELDEAERLLREARAGCEKALGPTHELTLIVTGNIGGVLNARGDAAAELAHLREHADLCTRLLGPDSEVTLTVRNNLGTALCESGDSAEGFAMLRDVAERSRRTLGDAHPDTVRAVTNLAHALLERRRTEEAGQLFRECLATCRRELPADHRLTLGLRQAMASFLERTGDPAGAEEHVREALAGFRRTLPADHASVRHAALHLARVLHRADRSGEAEQHYRWLLDSFRRTGEPARTDVLTDYGELLGRMGRVQDAEAVYREAIAWRREHAENDDRGVLELLGRLGDLLVAQGRLADAGPVLVESLDRSQRRLAADDVMTRAALRRLGELRYAEKSYAEAERLMREYMEACRRVHGPAHPDTRFAVANLATVLGSVGRAEEAVPLQREVLAAMQNTTDQDERDLLTMHHNLAVNLSKCGELEEAERHNRIALPGLRRILPADHATVRSSIGELGNLLVKLGDAARSAGRFADAERRYREAYDLRVERYGERGSHTVEVLEKLVALCEAWSADDPGGERDAEASTWHERLRGARGGTK